MVVFRDRGVDFESLKISDAVDAIEFNEFGLIESTDGEPLLLQKGRCMR